MRGFDENEFHHARVFVAAKAKDDRPSVATASVAPIVGHHQPQQAAAVPRQMDAVAMTFPSGNPYPEQSTYRRKNMPHECLRCYATDHQFIDCPMNPRRGAQRGRGQGAGQAHHVNYHQFQQMPRQQPYPQYQQQYYSPQPQQFYQQPMYPSQEPVVTLPPPTPQQQPQLQLTAGQIGARPQGERNASGMQGNYRPS